MFGALAIPEWIEPRSHSGFLLDSSLAEGRGSGSVKWIMYLTAVKLVDSAQLQLVNLEVCRLNNQARQLS